MAAVRFAEPSDRYADDLAVFPLEPYMVVLELDNTATMECWPVSSTHFLKA